MNTKRAEQYRAATKEDLQADDDNEIDPEAKISEAEGGAWVQTWHWIDENDDRITN